MHNIQNFLKHLSMFCIFCITDARMSRIRLPLYAEFGKINSEIFAYGAAISRDFEAQVLQKRRVSTVLKHHRSGLPGSQVFSPAFMTFPLVVSPELLYPHLCSFVRMTVLNRPFYFKAGAALQSQPPSFSSPTSPNLFLLSCSATQCLSVS